MGKKHYVPQQKWFSLSSQYTLWSRVSCSILPFLGALIMRKTSPLPLPLPIYGCPAWRLRALVVHVSFTAEAFACSRRRALGLIIVWKYPPPCLPRLHTALSLVGVIRNLVISREVVQGTSPTNEVINQYIGIGGQGREDVIALESASKCSAD